MAVSLIKQGQRNYNTKKDLETIINIKKLCQTKRIKFYLSNDIKLYSIFLQNGDVIVRCTEDSIGFVDVELPPFEDIYDNGNYIGDNPKFL